MLMDSQSSHVKLLLKDRLIELLRDGRRKKGSPGGAGPPSSSQDEEITPVGRVSLTVWWNTFPRCVTLPLFSCLFRREETFEDFP